jgi:hypothetical protein
MAKLIPLAVLVAERFASTPSEMFALALDESGVRARREGPHVCAGG